MNLKINIVANENDKNKADYVQIGVQDAAKRFSGIVHDKASSDDTAKAYIINDKVVSLEEFSMQKKDLLTSINEKENELFITNKVEKYSTKYKTNVVQEEKNFKIKGRAYANSRFNLDKTLTPIRIGLTDFDKSQNAKKAEKNFFQIAKDFVTAKQFRDNMKVKFDEFKNNIKAQLTAKPALSAANISLAYQLQELKIELETIKNSKEAEQLLIEHKKEQTEKQNLENEAKREAQKIEDEKKKNAEKIEDDFSVRNMLREVKDLFEKYDDLKDLSEKIHERHSQIKEIDESKSEIFEQVAKFVEYSKTESENINKDIVQKVEETNDEKLIAASNLMNENAIVAKSLESVKNFAEGLAKIAAQTETQLEFNQMLNTAINNLKSNTNEKEMS